MSVYQQERIAELVPPPSVSMVLYILLTNSWKVRETPESVGKINRSFFASVWQALILPLKPQKMNKAFCSRDGASVYSGNEGEDLLVT